MAKPLRSQLNQIRAWVQQGRTDAWIAHQLDVSTAELQEFRRRHELNSEASTDEVDLRDEIEAEIEAAMDAEPEPDDEPEDEDDEEEEPDDGADANLDSDFDSEPAADSDSGAAGDDDEAQPRRRRRRRGGRGRGRAGSGTLQATLQHGDPDGYGLWLDPAVQDNPVYAEHWAGHKEVEVDVQPDQIIIKRS
jgi:hypothetical protein